MPGLIQMNYSRVIKYAVLLMALLSLVCCANKESSEDSTGSQAGLYAKAARSAVSDENTAPQAPASVEKLKSDGRKLIKTGSISFECRDLAQTRAHIVNTVNSLDGYIVKDDSSRYADHVSHSLVIRVPADRFDRLVDEITAGVKKLDGKHIEVQDVTEEFIDIKTRLEIRKETEARYRELLKQARNVKEILAIEEQIGKQREQIESAEGRLKYLTDRIAFSTLTVRFYEKRRQPVGFGPKFREGIYNGWINFVWFLVGLVNIWPFIVFGFIALWGLRKIIRIRRSRKASS